MTAATLDLPMSTGFARSFHSDWATSEQDMYVAVTVAWYQMCSREERRRHPLGPYVLGPRFTRFVADAPVERGLVASVCAEIARRHTLQRSEHLPTELLPHEALDPAVAWWRELAETGGLGVHYVELGGGTLEFVSVARKDDQPAAAAWFP
jgi:hypothetical protein